MATTDLPVLNAMNAAGRGRSFVPSALRNLSGSNSSGLSHRVGSWWTAQILASSVVPAGMSNPPIFVSLSTLHGHRKNWVIELHVSAEVRKGAYQLARVARNKVAVLFTASDVHGHHLSWSESEKKGLQQRNDCSVTLSEKAFRVRNVISLALNIVIE